MSYLVLATTSAPMKSFSWEPPFYLVVVIATTTYCSGVEHIPLFLGTDVSGTYETRVTGVLRADFNSCRLLVIPHSSIQYVSVKFKSNSIRSQQTVMYS